MPHSEEPLKASSQMQRSLTNLTSMTGFGRSEVLLPGPGTTRLGRGNTGLPMARRAPLDRALTRRAGPPEGARAVVEIQALNHRFLEIECRLPEGFQRFEPLVRAMVARWIRRGRVRVWLNVASSGLTPSIQLKTDLARAYVRELRRLRETLRVPGEITLAQVLSLPKVVSLPEAESPSLQSWPALREGFSQALEAVVTMRRQEGARLGRALQSLTRELVGLTRRIQRRLPALEKGLAFRWEARVRSLVKKVYPKGVRQPRASLDSGAIAAEAALLLKDSDVREEIDRIDSHLSALAQIVGGGSRRRWAQGGGTSQGSLRGLWPLRAKGPAGESPGRTVDFLAQELHREVNTLGAKLRDPVAARWVVAMKGRIESLREQAANVE